MPPAQNWISSFRLAGIPGLVILFTCLAQATWHPDSAGTATQPSYYVEGKVAEPRIFAEGIISTTNDEAGGTFSPDGTEFYFTRLVPYTTLPRLGILCIEIDSKIAKLLPDLRQPDGLIVAAKSPDGQGRYIDLKSGDVIHTLNDQPVGSLETFRTIIAGLKTGEPVALLVERSAVFRYIAFEIE